MNVYPPEDWGEIRLLAFVRKLRDIERSETWKELRQIWIGACNDTAEARRAVPIREPHLIELNRENAEIEQARELFGGLMGLARNERVARAVAKLEGVERQEILDR